MRHVQVVDFIRTYYSARLLSTSDEEKQMELYKDYRRDLALVYALGAAPAPADVKAEDAAAQLLAAVDSARNLFDRNRMIAGFNRLLTVGVSKVATEHVSGCGCSLSSSSISNVISD